jgi:hypothetical protein
MTNIGAPMFYTAPFWDEQYMLNQNVLAPDILALGVSRKRALAVRTAPLTRVTRVSRAAA